MRRNAVRVCHGRPTRPGPLSASSSHALAGLWNSLSLSAAYSRMLASTITGGLRLARSYSSVIAAAPDRLSVTVPDPGRRTLAPNAVPGGRFGAADHHRTCHYRDRVRDRRPSAVVALPARPDRPARSGADRGSQGTPGPWRGDRGDRGSRSAQAAEMDRPWHRALPDLLGLHVPAADDHRVLR